MIKQKSLAENSVFFAAYRFLNVIYPLVTVAYVSRIIFANGVGRIASAINIAQYFVYIAALGIPNYGIREIAKNRDTRDGINKLFTELFIINAISTGLATLCYYFYINVETRFSGDYYLYIIAGVMVIINFFYVVWVYQGQEQFSYIMIRNFVVKIISLLCIITFVHEKDDYLTYAIIYVGGYTGNNIINCIHLKRNGIKLVFNDLEFKIHLKPIFIMLCTTVAIELYTMVDTTMLTFLGNPEVVGYYSNAIKTVKVLVSLITSICVVLLPRLSYYFGIGQLGICEDIVNRTIKVLIFFLLPCFAGFFLVTDSIVPVLFGNDFLPAVTTTRILSFLIPVLGFSSLFGTQILLTFNKESNLLISTMVGAAINITLNTLLIPRLLQNGAAIASVASELVVTILTLFFAKKALTIRFSYKNIFKSFISTLMMAASVLPFGFVSCGHLQRLAFQILIGFFVYVSTGFLLHNETLYEIVALIKKVLTRKQYD